jgi:hypothetical protein
MSVTWEATSFILHALGSLNQQNPSLATASTLLLMLAPLWINASVYMTVGRPVYYLHPEKKVRRLEEVRLGKWFVWLDVLSFLIQVTGGLMMNQVFGAVIVRFHLDMIRLEREGVPGISGKQWKWLMYTLYTALALIVIRIIFRVVEFSASVDFSTNALIFTEGNVLGLDAVPMMLAVLLLAVVHQSVGLKDPESEFLSKKERKSEKKARKAEKRKRGHVDYVEMV